MTGFELYPQHKLLMSCGTSRTTMKTINLATLIECLQGRSQGGGGPGVPVTPSFVLLKDILADEQ